MSKVPKTQKGFTLIEMTFCILGILTMVLAGSIFYAGFHFLSKVW